MRRVVLDGEGEFIEEFGLLLIKGLRGVQQKQDFGLHL